MPALGAQRVACKYTDIAQDGSPARAREKKRSPVPGAPPDRLDALAYFTIVVSTRVTTAAIPSAMFAPMVRKRLSTA